MRAIILFFVMLLSCPLAQVVAPPATPAPSVPPSRVEISSSATAVRVGETIIISGVPVNLGLPIYTLTLSSGASASVSYDDQPRDLPAQDAVFEIVAAHGEMNRVTFTLRALAPGSADAILSATGEARSPEGAFMWSGGASEPLALAVSE